MKRREFIAMLGSAPAWPLTANAQTDQRVRSIGFLMNVAAGNPEGKARVAAFVRGFEDLGWAQGKNFRNHLPVGQQSR